MRDKLVHLVTNHRFDRLMPEDFSEIMEILKEIKRVRPDWLRETPYHWFFNRLKKGWTRKTGGFWVRCARSPESEARSIAHAEGDLIEEVHTQSKMARKEIIGVGWKRIPAMDEVFVRFCHPFPGWRGDMVEAWRVDAFTGLSDSLGRQGNAYRDWMAPFVELDDGLLSSADWVEFWLYLADKSALPMQWMRWAHSFAQRFRKVTPGSPGDTQLCTYFLATDIVITTDKALVDILEQCRPYAPRRLPTGALVPGGAPAV